VTSRCPVAKTPHYPGPRVRPPVDVVVPFFGSSAELVELCEHLDALAVGQDDTISVVDNRPAPSPAHGGGGRVRVVPAPELQTSYFARNRGAEAGHAPWLLFVDADVRVPTDLIDRYFETDPAPDTAVLAGEIRNEPIMDGDRRSAAERYAYLAELFAQHKTLDNAAFAYAMTANCAIRRDAFESIGGFVDHIISGGDADICFRLRQAGYGLEARDDAAVTHVSRPTVRKLLRQSARHGSGAAWLHALYPGFSKPGRLLGLAVRSSRAFALAAVAAIRGDRDRALVTSIDAARSIAFEMGRRRSNEVSAPPARA
jgi:GT2 family glycosyltransferase